MRVRGGSGPTAQIVGREGAEQVLEPAMDAAERERLEHSADVLRRAAEQLVQA